MWKYLKGSDCHAFKNLSSLTVLVELGMSHILKPLSHMQQMDTSVGRPVGFCSRSERKGERLKIRVL